MSDHLGMPPSTLAEIFRTTVHQLGDQPALGIIQQGQLSWLSWSQLAELVGQASKRLRSLGYQPQDRLVHAGPNSLAWIVLDLAITEIGAVPVPLHANSSAAEQTRLAAIASARAIVTAASQRSEEGWKVSVAEDQATAALPRDPAPKEIPEDLGALLFTSGTSGEPRGVMLSHQNLVANVVAVSEAVGNAAEQAGSPPELRLNFLPFSHIYARTCDLYSWIYRGNRMVLAESRETILRDAQLVKPTAINGVPYFYQKVFDQCQSQKVPSLKDLLGGAVERCYSGGAMVSPALQAVYAEQGLPLLSGYGLSEAAPVVTVSTAMCHRAGTVGKPLPGVEVQLSEEQEILVRGPNVMLGYWQAPGTTTEVLRDGWLHTGDLGRWDADGFLVIEGRKKETMVLATGKNVSPALVEARLGASPWIEQAAVMGDGQNCLVAIIVPSRERLRAAIREQRLVLRWLWSKRQALNHAKIKSIIQSEIDRCLEDLPADHQVRDFYVLGRGFSQEQGEMTAKLSLRRDTVAQRFAGEIAGLYRSLAKRRS